jgi:hypothetical protein
MNTCHRGLWLLAGMCVLGCLEPRAPYLTRMDTQPPTVTQSAPVPLTGATGPVPRNEPFTVTFSEKMDSRSLIGGIQLFRVNAPVELVYTLPLPGPTEDDIDVGDVPYVVGFTPALGQLDANLRHTLVYSTILTDTEGNPLQQEIRLTFTTAP